jgi:hypothetical protein
MNQNDVAALCDAISALLIIIVSFASECVFFGRAENPFVGYQITTIQRPKNDY